MIHQSPSQVNTRKNCKWGLSDFLQWPQKHQDHRGLPYAPVEERVHETWPCHAVGRYSAPRGRRSDTGHNLAAEVMPGGGWPPVSALKNRGAVQGPAGAEPLSGPRDRISADKVCTCGNHEAMCIKEFYSEHESNHRGWWGEDTCGN